MPQQRKNRSKFTRLRRFSRRTLVALFVLGTFYAVLPSVAAAFRPDACAPWKNREVPVEVLEGEELVRLRRETTIIKVPSYMAAWPRDGISFPGIVAVSDQRVLAGEDTLLWHEMVHQHQYRRDGAVPFMARYVLDWHRGLLRGCRHETAYEAIGYELETDALLQRMRVDLGGVHSEDFERITLMLEDPSLRLPRVTPRLYSKPVTTVAPSREAFERPPP